ncbi:helix-turn-helix domain-containing protein [Lentzea sp. BCCO 10_0856]|uniref:Helix-turn-helix domain-containing protein n=1 Tax=Lentzea miocenica TaxID=3095431 RepID=A0ABU4TE18_9PSEU|nr:helix-turn-helix domain-containing protein [Lentzea sp. BCCO 10_0856]MDX8036435.1 helix-turn-helix domain-containing protein [Lentzea sp. BCCO 10_0856]
MLRVHFTAEDLARVRVAPGPDPMWEILLSLHVLRQRSATPVFGTWRATVRTTLPDDARWLMRLAPPVGYSPDFLTPTAGSCALDAGIDAVLSTPVASLRADLAQLDHQHRLDQRTHLLASGDVATLDSLGEALRTYHHRALAPIWDDIRAVVDAERAVRARSFLDGGCEGMLAALHPTISWAPPVLSIESRFPHRDIHLHGQGLVLVPSYFCRERPIMLRDQSRSPVLVYPVARDLHVASAGKRSLEALLGRTRAAALGVIAGGCTTTELARRLGISAASASAHATVLRDAGLAVAQRHRNSVLHTASALGVELLT